MANIELPKQNGALFLTFEGPEGSGKTTQIKRLAEFLVHRGKDVICTREPGGTKFGDVVRKMFLELSDQKLHPETELFMMLAQRKEHLEKVIIPALKNGKIVLCDRYIDSSIAYQGYGRGIAPSKIWELHIDILGPCLPHGTIIFDIEPVIGLERARCNRRNELDRMEHEDIAFHNRVREGYLCEVKKNPERFILIDARNDPEIVFENMKNRLIKKFPEVLSC